MGMDQVDNLLKETYDKMSEAFNELNNSQSFYVVIVGCQNNQNIVLYQIVFVRFFKKEIYFGLYTLIFIVK